MAGMNLRTRSGTAWFDRQGENPCCRNILRQGLFCWKILKWVLRPGRESDMIMISEKYVFSILIKAVTGRGGENAMTEKISTCAVGFYSYTTKLGAQIQ
jgi:hypothetical protein